MDELLHKIQLCPMLENFEQALGYRFATRALLVRALIHKSFANEKLKDPAASNERLEFLGDAVLDLVVARHLYSMFPALPEGELSRVRSELVSAAALATLARTLNLGGYLRLGRGEEHSGGRDKDNILADALEAVFGAMFLDSDLKQATKIIVALLDDKASERVQQESHDYKTRLQEEVQARFGETPEYVLCDQSGPDHARSYQVQVCYAGRTIGYGSGKSKKAAQQKAAQMALNQIDLEPEHDIESTLK
ncbi:MAG: ribonuclease III [Desulfuromonadaceae bacterium]|nr:ribonuclease III [Desulfuromonas sp.]MDY0184654.1 ribonuclease III [Desulfuromonadaceae bacterium]